MADAAGPDRDRMNRPGVVPLIGRSWRAPGEVYRALRGMPDRVQVVVLMAAMLIFLVAQAPTHARAAQLDPEIPLSGRMAGALFAVMFIMPLVCYALASLISALSRLTARRIAPEDSRLALFWALLAVAPAMLLAGLVSGLVGQGGTLVLCQLVAGVGFLFIWGSGLRVLSKTS